MSITYSIESPDTGIQSFGEKIGMSSNGNIVVTHHGDFIYIYNIDDRSNIILEKEIKPTEFSDISTINEIAVNEDGNLIIIAYVESSSGSQKLIQITNKSEESSLGSNSGTNWQIIGTNIYYVNYEGILYKYNNAERLVDQENSSITDYSIISEDIFVYVKDGEIFDKGGKLIDSNNDGDDTSITKVAIKEKKDDSNGYYIVYSRESTVYIKDNDLNNYNSIAINNIRDIDISNGGNKVMIIFEESTDNFKVRKYEYDTNNDWVEMYSYSGGENYIRISDDGYTTIWSSSSDNNKIEFTKAYFYKDFTIIIDVEGRDDPLGITDSNVEVEINEDESLQIYIDSYLDFYLVDTDDTIRYGIDTNYGLNLGNVILHNDFETNGQLTYTPYENVSGTDKIKILGIDSSGNETVGMLSITINAVDDSATGGISLSGEFLPNTTVTVDTSAIKDIDDDTNNYSFSYTYLLDNNIEEKDSSSSTFLLPDNNDSQTIKVEVEVKYNDDSNKNVKFTAEEDIREFSLVTTNNISDSNIFEDEIYSYNLKTIIDSNIMSSDDVEFEINEDAQNGTANIDSNKVLTVIPDENYNGSINVEVTARTDTNITSITENVKFNLIVQNVNDSPYFYNTIYINNVYRGEDGAVTYNLQTMVKDDDDEDTLTFSVDSNNEPQYGTVTFNGYDMTYTANVNYSETSDSYKIIASDNNGGIGVGTVEVAIVIPDAPPVFIGDSNYVFQQGDEFSFKPFDDDKIFVISIDNSTPLPSFLQINNQTIETKNETTNDDVGQYSFIVIADDGNNSPVSQQITLTIEDVNDAPIFDGDFSEKTIFPNSLYEKTVQIYDPDGHNITVTVDGPTWLSYQITSNNNDTNDMSDVNVQLSGTPTRDDGGTTTITITAEDDNDSSVRTIATYDLTVYVEENNPPVFIGDSNYVFAQGEDISFTLPFTDDGLFEITIDTGDPLPSFLRLNNKTIETKNETTNDDVGQYSFTVIADDGNNSPVSQQITLTIEDVNDAPIFDGDFSEKTIFPNSLYEKTVQIYDPDGHNITVTVDGPTWLSYQITSNNNDTNDMSDVNVQLSGTPTRDDGGTTTITITAEDDNDSSVRTIATYDLTVYVEENNPPVFIGDSNYVFAQGEDISFTLPFTDDGLFEITIDTGDPLPSFLRLNNKTIETKNETTNDDVGQYSFTVIATDEYNTVSQQITLTIEDVNDSPIFEGDFSSETILPNTAYEKTIRIYDIDGQNIAVTVDGPSWLLYDTVSNNADTNDMSDVNVILSGTPNDDNGGKTTITITAEDESNSNVKTVATYDLTVLVEPNDPPVFTGDSNTDFSFNQGEDIEISVSFRDDDGDNVGVSFEDLPDFLQYDAINSKIYGTTTNDNVGVYNNITITGNDGNGGVATKIIHITINDVNDTPEFSGISEGDQILVFAENEINKDIVVKDIDGNNIILEYEGLPEWVNVNTISNNNNDTNDMSDITIELRGETTLSDGGSSSVKITAIDGLDSSIKNELSFQIMVFGGTTGGDNSNLVGIICFLEGSKILTDEGYKRIETLERGSMIKTCNNGYIPIKYIGYSKFNNPCHGGRIKERLYEYEDKNLVLTGCHSVLKRNLTKEQEYKIKENYDNIFLTDGYYRLPAFLDESNKPYRKGGIQKIYHIALESCNINMNYGIYANDLLVESCAIYDFDYYCVTKI